MNIYQMYHENGNEFNFHVVRDGWATVFATVTSIEGVEQGEQIEGVAPYYGNPKVYADFFKKYGDQWFYHDTKELSCPGNYSYKMVDLSMLLA